MITTPADLKFQMLHDKFRPEVFRIAMRFLKNEADAEDVVQTVMLSLHRALQVDEVRSPRPWFAEATKNAALNVLRSRKHDISLDELTDEGGSDLEPREDPYEPPEIDPRLAQALRAAVDALPAKTAEVMSRFYFGSQSVAMIAREMKITQSTVTSHLTHGRSALRQLFTRSTRKVAA